MFSLGVAEQEMLHLTLAGNILRALDASQKLYNKDFVPEFKGNTRILYDDINLNLEAAEKTLLETFIKVHTASLIPYYDVKQVYR